MPVRKWFWIIGALLACSASGQVTITGTFQNPDGSPVNGSVRIILTQPNVTNTCGTSRLVSVFAPVVAQITNGNLGSLDLYATTCLTQGTTGTAFVSTATAAGQGATITLGFLSFRRVVTLVGGTSGAVPGLVAQIFPAIAGSNNRCLLTPENMASGGLGATYTWNGQAVSITTPVPLASGTSYVWFLDCGQPYTVYVSGYTSAYSPVQGQLYKALWLVPNVTTADITEIGVQ